MTTADRLVEAIGAARAEGLVVTDARAWETVERNPVQRGRVGYVEVDHGAATIDLYPEDAGPLGLYAVSHTSRGGVSSQTFGLRTILSAARTLRAALDGTAALKSERERLARIRRKGHDCDEHKAHGYDPESALGDYYTCGICGDLLQVG